ncbi:MAG: hypothetical protein ACREUZ_11865 [Burkholderiales bacterium]
MAGITAIAQDKPAAAPPQEKPPAATPAPRERAEPVPLKVTVVLSRHKGDKKISSLPYVLGVASNSHRTTLRMGVQVPVATTVFGAQQGEGKSIPQTSYQYRDVGTNIDCVAATLSGGVYQLIMTVEDSSLQLHADPAQKDTQSAARIAEVPAFRNFKSSFGILLKDGQTTQYTSATDPVSGEVMKIDLTLNVLK